MERVQEPAAAAPAAAEDAIMALYDACWFHRCVLLPPPPPAPAQSLSPPEGSVADLERWPQHLAVPSSSSSPAAAAGLRHRRTRSDEATATTAAAAFQQGLEPLRIPNARARLETILSGKDGLVAAPQPPPLPDRRRPDEARGAASRRPRRRQRQRRGRSMSELEFEELKGLQDLGFTFADAEVDAELASIVPGLRRKRSEGVVQALATAEAVAPSSSSSSAQEEEEHAAFDDDAPRRRRRPYLSEAWDDEDEELRATLSNWRIPPAVDGANLKESLRIWAHTVASAVR